MTDAIIEITGLKKTFRSGDVDVHALRGIDLSVQRGEFLAVIGPSGSGKSTLFHILGGLTPSTDGRIVINGKDMSHLNDGERTALRKHVVGFVFQKYNLLPTLTVGGNIDIARDIANRKGPFDEQFLEVLRLLGLDKKLDRKPRQLSGGEQQRVAIARAIVNHPAILLADEPTGNLDTENSNAVLDVLRGLNKKIGQTILMITHNPEAAAFADRIVRMRDGHLE